MKSSHEKSNQKKKEEKNKNDKKLDEELKEFIKEATVWYKSEPETQEERLKIMRRMLEVFKDED